MRCDHGQDGNNCFVYRQPLILEAIKREKPDVLCFQEVLPHMAAWLKQNLDEYYVIGCGRGKKLDSEQMTVAFKKYAYTLIEMQTFWLSETPTVPGTIYPGQSDNPRCCTDAVLMEETSGKLIRVLNTHLDHVSEDARERGLRLILDHVEKEQFFADAPMILTGDFNAEPGAKELSPLFEDPKLSVVSKDIGATYHGYERAKHPSLIDYIVLRGALSCEKIWKWTDEKDGVYLSDHYPVCADIAIC